MARLAADLQAIKPLGQGGVGIHKRKGQRRSIRGQKREPLRIRQIARRRDGVIRRDCAGHDQADLFGGKVDGLDSRRRGRLIV